MKIGMFGYPGDHLIHTKAVVDALKENGAEKIVCLGGLVWSAKTDELISPPGTVLRWLRTSDIPTLTNDTDRQVAGWRLQALDNTTGYIRKSVRQFLNAITREEAQWLYSRPTMLPIDNVLCCADNLTIDALFPVPLTRYNALRLFNVMEQRAAFFPSANGPGVIVRKQDDSVIEASNFQGVEEQLDSPKSGVIIGGVLGHPPLNANLLWGAVADSDGNQVSLICLDAKTHKSVPEQASLLLQRTTMNWQGAREFR